MRSSPEGPCYYARTMEMLDVLNPDGTPTGEQKSKEEVHTQGLWHRAAHVWFVNGDGEILLQKRAANIRTYPGVFDVSAAGHLTAGDTPIEGALREVAEELGVQLAKDELVKIGEVAQQVTVHDGAYINNEWNDVYVVWKNIPIEDFTFTDHEVECVRYVPRTELKEWVRSGGENLVMHPGEFELLFAYLENN